MEKLVCWVFFVLELSLCSYKRTTGKKLQCQATVRKHWPAITELLDISGLSILAAFLKKCSSVSTQMKYKNNVKQKEPWLCSSNVI